MALVGPKLKAKMQKTIEAGLKKNFGSVSATDGYAGISAEQWQKIADAISDIALDVVEAIQQDAEVAAGIPVATTGGLLAQIGVSIAPGKVI